METIKLLPSSLFYVNNKDTYPPFKKGLYLEEYFLEYMKKNNMCICTGNLSKDICKLEFKNNRNASHTKRYKMPKLIELYRFYYNEDFEGQHNADGDVRALMQCLSKM